MGRGSVVCYSYNHKLSNEDNVMEWITDNWENVIGIATSVVGAFAILATMTPNPQDDKIVSKLYSLINFLGANFGQSKNDESK